MRKASREMPAEWALEVMHKAPYMTVSLTREDGTAYGLPLSLASEDDKHWYFHCALEGEKLDAIKAHPEVCLSAVGKCRPTVGPKDGSFTMQFHSAIAFGKAELVTDEAEKIKALRLICERFLPQHMDAFDTSIERSLGRTAVVRITLTSAPTGKRKEYDEDGEELKWQKMMKKTLLTLFLLLGTLSLNAQDIKLPQPDTKQNSMSVVEALKTRHSVRSFDASKELSEQQLSTLCWAACGMTRDDNHRTAPTAMNRQEIRLFAFTKTAVYEYNAKANTLVKKADGDHRDLLASGGAKPANGKGGFRQDFVLDAPVTLMMVIDYEIFTHQDEKAVMMGCVDAGNVSENINLYCQSVGLATVPRATMDTDGIRKLLGFTDKQLPVMNNPVGFEKVVP